MIKQLLNLIVAKYHDLSVYLTQPSALANNGSIQH